jgi:hypothetical protein
VCSFHKFGKAAKAGYNLLSNLYYRKAAFSKQLYKSSTYLVHLLLSESRNKFRKLNQTQPEFDDD